MESKTGGKEESMDLLEVRVFFRSSINKPKEDLAPIYDMFHDYEIITQYLLL